MHELSIVQNVMQIVLENLKEKEYETILEINLKVGEFSGVVSEALQFSFEAIKEDTEFSACSLNIDIIPFLAECQECKKQYNIESEFFLICPSCNSQEYKIVSGRELYVDSVEVD